MLGAVLLLAALDAVAELAAPRRCAGCDEPRMDLCDQCLRRLVTHLGEGAQQVCPTPCPSGFPSTWALTSYDGVVAALIRAHKDGGRHDLAPLLGRLLAAVLAEIGTAGQPVVVPAPSSAAAERARGRAPMYQIARAAAHSHRLPEVPALRMVRRVRDQAGLTRGARSANLAGSMTVRSRSLIQGRPVLLVDDVVTTGATLVEARRALLRAGATQVYAGVLAATQRRVKG